MSEKSKQIIGWTAYVAFPEWDIPRVKAKVDTGARTSALHVDGLKKLSGERVRFDVILSRRDQTRRVTVEAPVVRWDHVRSSIGIHTRRPFVKTRVRIGKAEKEIEVSLISRHDMVFRMLLGRTALEGDFLVDVSRKAERPKKKPLKDSQKDQKPR